MRRVLLLVEGQTEEAFTNNVLCPHLAPFGVHAERASMLRTKELPSGKPYKGGVTTYGKMRRDALRLLGDTSATVTTMIDHYGLPDDFPSIAKTPLTMDPAKRVSQLEAAFSADIGNERFRPFLMLHEFEAWVFAVPKQAERHFGLVGLGSLIEQAVMQCGGPELINHGALTHPSVRLEGLLASRRRHYGKVSDGPEIVRTAGLTAVRRSCPHLDRWLSWLEGLGQQ